MDTFVITTTGNYEVMLGLFNAIASIFHSQGGSFINTFARFSASMALLGTVMYCVFASNLKPLGMWFLSYMVILNGLFLPVSRVIVKDSMTGQHGTIDNVPFGLSVVAGGFNQFSHALTQMVDQAFQAAPGAELEQKEAAVSRLSYLQTGFIFGAHAIMQMKGLQINDADFAGNIKEFVQQCVVIDCLIGNKYTIHDLKTTNDLWGLVSAQPSKMRGLSWKEVARGADGKFAGSAATQIITCAEGVARINQLWAASTQSTVGDIVDGLRQAMGLKGNHQHDMSAQLSQHMPFALNHLMGVAQSSSDIIKQQLMIDTIVDATERKAVELGAAPNFEARRAYLQARAQNETTGHVIAMTLPYFKTVLEAMMYALFLFVFPLSLLPKGWQVLSIWAKGCMWVSLWPPLFAILNFFITEGLRIKVGGAVGNGLSIATSVGVYNAAADMASIAGYLSASIPLLAWWIVDRSSYSLVSMAGSMLASSQSAVAAASQESFAGNYSYGNVNLDNTQGSQTNLFKHDTSPSYNAGHFTTNDGASSVVTELGGEQILNVARSVIPVEIDSASYQETQARDAYTREMGLHTSHSEQALQQQTLAAGEFLEFGKQSAKTLTSGQHFSSQETAQVATDAATVYNQAHDISQRYGLNEDSVNQLTARASVGGSVSIGMLKFAHVGVDASLDKTEMSQATLQKAVDEITHLGQSSEFRDSMQHTRQAVQAGQFEDTDQATRHLASNVNSRMEQSQQHQTEASKALSRAQSLNHTVERIRGDSQRINLVETQAFVNYASEKLGGIEAVQEMALNNPHHLRAMGDQYLREKYETNAQLPVTQAHLAGQYTKSNSGAAPAFKEQAQHSANMVRGFARQEGLQEIATPSLTPIQQSHPISQRTDDLVGMTTDPSIKREMEHAQTLDSSMSQDIVSSTPVDSAPAALQKTEINLDSAMIAPESSVAPTSALQDFTANPVITDISHRSGGRLQPLGPEITQDIVFSTAPSASQEVLANTEKKESPAVAPTRQGNNLASFDNLFQEAADSRISQGPINNPALSGQVQQMVGLVQRDIQQAGRSPQDQVIAKQQQFTQDKQDFKKQKLGAMHNKPQPTKAEEVPIVY